MYRPRAVWFVVMVSATIVAILTQPTPASATCPEGEACVLVSNFGPGVPDSGLIQAADPSGVVYYAIKLPLSTALSVGFSTLREGKAGAWLEVSGRQERPDAGSITSGSCRVTSNSSGFASCSIAADPGAAEGRMTVEVLRGGTVVSKQENVPAGKVATMQGWPNHFAVEVDPNRRTIYSWGFGRSISMMAGKDAAVTSTKGAAASASIEGDGVRITMTGRPIEKLSVVDVRGVLPHGLMSLAGIEAR